MRYLKPVEELTGLTHCFVRVSLPDGKRYLADVGFSGINSIAPVQMDVDEFQSLPEGQFRLVAENGIYALERHLAGDILRTLYLFKDELALERDLSMSNWYMCSHPEGRWMGCCFASRVVGNTRRHIQNGSYVIRQADGKAETTLIKDKAQLMSLLDTVFGLVPADDEGLDKYL